MKLTTTSVLKDLSGKNIGEEGQPPLTARTACTNALLGHHPEDERISGDEKFGRFKLAAKINDAEEVDLSAEDVVLLKKMIARSFSPLVLGPMYLLLESES